MSANEPVTESASVPAASEKVEYSYPELPPRDIKTLTPKQYIDERLNQSMIWYDKNSGKNKDAFLRMRAATVIGGAIVPVLVNIDFPYIKILTTIISLMVVMFVSLESVYHFREQWTNYRSTEQFLRKEYFIYTAGEGPYAQVDEDEGFRLFVERVEKVIDSENAFTLQVLSTVPDTETKQQGPVVK